MRAARRNECASSIAIERARDRWDLFLQLEYRARSQNDILLALASVPLCWRARPSQLPRALSHGFATCAIATLMF